MRLSASSTKPIFTVHCGSGWQRPVSRSPCFSSTMLIRRITRKRYARMAATPQMEFLELPLKATNHTGVLFLLIVSIYAGSVGAQCTGGTGEGTAERC